MLWPSTVIQCWAPACPHSSRAAGSRSSWTWEGTDGGLLFLPARWLGFESTPVIGFPSHSPVWTSAQTRSAICSRGTNGQTVALCLSHQPGHLPEKAGAAAAKFLLQQGCSQASLKTPQELQCTLGPGKGLQLGGPVKARLRLGRCDRIQEQHPPSPAQFLDCEQGRHGATATTLIAGNRSACTKRTCATPGICRMAASSPWSVRSSQMLSSRSESLLPAGCRGLAGSCRMTTWLGGTGAPMLPG